MLEIQQGKLVGIRQIASPNQDQRPDEQDISLIVIHGISLPPGQYGGPYIEQLFSNTLNPDDDPYFAEIAALRVSAHCLIRRDGELLQFVPFHRRAWHAGQSNYCGRSACNDFSIGIELEGQDNEAYSVAQYACLKLLVTSLRQAYAIPLQAIVGHADIAPARKTDPGPAFDWKYFKDGLTNDPAQV